MQKPAVGGKANYAYICLLRAKVVHLGIPLTIFRENLLYRANSVVTFVT